MSLSTAPVRIGSYELLIELASGGMATVFVARQAGAAGFERLVVVKRVHPHLLRDVHFREMFRDEARVAALIRHPNVVSVGDVVESDGELFLVMDYIDSVPLVSVQRALLMTGARLAPAVAARIVADVLAGLHAAHEAVDMRGMSLLVVHRDVSPQNVIVGVDGTSRLIDFGIARAAHRFTETRSGSVKGKLGYMAPEQARALPVDRRTDVFAAGVVLHELLTGHRLFPADNEVEALLRLTEGAVPRPSQSAPELPAALDEVVMRALAPDTAGRFQTAAAFLEGLEAALPPAPSREVAASVERLCGARLGERRAALTAILQGGPAPRLRGFPPDGGGLSMADDAAAASASGREPVSRTNDSRAPGPSTDGAGTNGTGSPIVAMREAYPPRSRLGPVTLVLGGLLLAAAGGGAVLVAQGSGPAPGPAAAAPSSAPPPLPAPIPAVAAADAAAPGSPAEAEIMLAVVANAPLESLRTKGLQRVALDGNRARLWVSPWRGGLPIEAVVAGGQTARVVADEEGPRELRLEVDRSSAAHPAPPPHVPASGAPPKKPASAAELHDNPY